MKRRYFIPKGTVVWKAHIEPYNNPLGRVEWRIDAAPNTTYTVRDWYFDDTCILLGSQDHPVYMTITDMPCWVLILDQADGAHEETNAFVVVQKLVEEIK